MIWRNSIIFRMERILNSQNALIAIALSNWQNPANNVATAIIKTPLVSVSIEILYTIEVHVYYTRFSVHKEVLYI